MSDWDSLAEELRPRDTPLVQCHLCKFLASADEDVRKLVTAYVGAMTADDEWVYSAEMLALALRKRGVKTSTSGIKRHRRDHVI